MLYQVVTIVASGLLVLLAVPPLSPEARKSQADLIVTGKVTRIAQSVEESRKDFSDTIYAIEFEISTIEKGAASKGVVIEIGTWRPATRPIGWAGPQGQNEIPGVGDVIRGFARKEADKYLFLTPNGIEVIRPATTQSTTEPASRPAAK